MGTHNQAIDRRRHERGTIATQSTRPHVISTIIGTFREMPGLCLDLNQAARLFGLPASTCEVILRDLVAQGTLRRAPDGQYLGAQLKDIRQIGQPSDLMPAARSGVRVTNSRSNPG
jgi:hypothetical protein